MISVSAKVFLLAQEGFSGIEHCLHRTVGQNFTYVYGVSTPEVP